MIAGASGADVRRLVKVSLLAGAALVVSTVPLVGLAMVEPVPLVLRESAFCLARTIVLPGKLLLRAVVSSPPAEADLSLRSLRLAVAGAGIDFVFWSAAVLGLLLAIRRHRLVRQPSSRPEETP